MKKILALQLRREIYMKIFWIFWHFCLVCRWKIDRRLSAIIFRAHNKQHIRNFNTFSHKDHRLNLQLHLRNQRHLETVVRFRSRCDRARKLVTQFVSSSFFISHYIAPQFNDINFKMQFHVTKKHQKLKLKWKTINLSSVHFSFAIEELFSLLS